MNLPDSLLQWMKERQTGPCHRQLLIISGTEQWAIESASYLEDQHNATNVLWVGNDLNAQQNTSIVNYRLDLGREYDWVVINCYSGFRANAVMALSGTVKAQGLMLLLCPDLDLWPEYKDPERVNRISYGFIDSYVNSPFFKLLSAAFSDDKFVAVYKKDHFSGSVALADAASTEHNFEQQSQAVEGIVKVATGHRNRPLVLTADRGRGKSSALGLAAAQLMAQRNKSIYVTALHLDNTEQILHHAKRMLPGANVTRTDITYRNATLTYKPVDQLLKDDWTIDLVMVDEASSLPIHVLISLAEKFPRIVFSSTVHGYEGSGRGFEIRFLQQLSKLKPEFKRTHMLQPIRWYKNDVLESFWFKAFFQSEQSTRAHLGPDAQIIWCKHVSKDSLISDKQLLGSVFKLLINAHYQTSQDDLQRLLDAPEVECFILQKGTTLLGVAQIVTEGGTCFNEFANDVAECTRRVKGHLVAQNITSSYNTAPFLLSKQWRISRIAIVDSYQRTGLGKQLIEYVEQQAKQKFVEFVTTSFGCNLEIIKFWYSLDYHLVKLSAKPEVSSGEHSGICIKALNSQASVVSANLRNAFYQELLYQMDKNLQAVSGNLLFHILLSEKKVDSIGLADVAIIRQFATGKRPYTSCKRLLRGFLITNPHIFTSLSVEESSFLVGALLQNLSDNVLRVKFGLTGKKKIEQTIKTIFNRAWLGSTENSI